MHDHTRAGQTDLAIARKLAATDPQNAQWERDLIVSHVKLAGLAETQRQDEDAVDHYAAALTIAREVAFTGRRAPADAKWLPDLDRRLAAACEQAGRGGGGD